MYGQSNNQLVFGQAQMPTGVTLAAGAQPVMQGMQAMQGMQGVMPGFAAAMPGQQNVGLALVQAPGTTVALAQNPAALQQQQAMQQAAYQQYAMRYAAYQRTVMAMQQAMQQQQQQPGMGMASGPNPMGFGAGMGQYGNVARPMLPASGGMGPMQRAPGTSSQAESYYKTRICQKWSQGQCSNGDTCKYAHGTHDLRPSAGSSGARTSGYSDTMDKRGGGVLDHFKKTRLCEEFVKNGSCRYGDKCTFAHGQHELRKPSSGNSVATHKEAGKLDTHLHKTRLCQAFMNTGKCPYGDKCTFAHGQHDLKSKAGQGRSTPSGTTPRTNGSGPQQPGAKRPRDDEGTRDDSKRPAPDTAVKPDPEPGTDPVKEEDTEAAPVGATAGDTDAAAVPAEGDAAAGQEEEQAADEENAVDAVDGVDDVLAMGSEQGNEGEPQEEDLGENDAEYGAAAEAEKSVEPECHLCARLKRAGKQKLMEDIKTLANPVAQRIGAVILGASPKLEELWSKVPPTQLLTMLDKPEVSINDKINLLKALHFHSHLSPEEREQLPSQKYVAQGLPADVADFLYLIINGKEATAEMQDYCLVLDICKSLYGVSDDLYFAMSNAIAPIMIGEV